MAPLMISNQKPGFVPLGMSPVSLASRAPRRSPFTPPAYRPPMLSNPAPRMGAGVFSITEIPLSLTLGMVGLSGLILAGVVPPPLKQVSTVVGLGFIGFSLLNLFSGTASAESAAPASGATPFPAAPADQFGKVTARIIKPSFSESVSRGYFSYDYDIEVLWTNHSDKAVTVPYRIYVEEKPEGVIGGEPFQGVAYTGTVNLGPGQSAQVPLEIDLQHRGFGAAQAVGVTLKVQKISSNGQVFDADQRFFVVYG